VDAVVGLHVAETGGVVVSIGVVPDAETTGVWVAKNGHIWLEASILLPSDDRVGNLRIALGRIDPSLHVFAAFDEEIIDEEMGSEAQP
jgi:hypothetical protein